MTADRRRDGPVSGALSCPGSPEVECKVLDDAGRMTDDGETLGQLNDEGDEVEGAREVALPLFSPSVALSGKLATRRASAAAGKTGY